MKFNKVLLGLMVVAPFTLASCNNAMSYEAVESWIENHYTKSDSERPDAVATFFWDYHATTSTGVGMQVVEDVFGKLKELARELGIDEKVIYFPGKDNPIGENKNVGIASKIYPLNLKALHELNPGTEYEGHFGKRRLNDDKSWDGHSYKETFKVYDNALTVTSTEDFSTTAMGSKKIDVSCAYAYNQEGYLSGYGFKIGRYFIDSDNIVKLKVTVELEYSH